MKATELAAIPSAPSGKSKTAAAKVHLVDLVRGRFEYPEFVVAAIALWRKWKVDWAHSHLVSEDKGSCSGLKNERI